MAAIVCSISAVQQKESKTSAAILKSLPGTSMVPAQTSRVNQLTPPSAPTPMPVHPLCAVRQNSPVSSTTTPSSTEQTVRVATVSQQFRVKRPAIASSQVLLALEPGLSFMDPAIRTVC